MKTTFFGRENSVRSFHGNVATGIGGLGIATARPLTYTMNQSPFAHKLLKGLLTLALVLTGLTLNSVTGVRAQAPCSSNPVACENSQPGNPASEWDIIGAGDASIQGFATDISVNIGQTVHF